MDAHSRDRNMLPSATALGASMLQATCFFMNNKWIIIDEKWNKRFAMGNENGTWIMYGVEWDDPAGIIRLMAQCHRRSRHHHGLFSCPSLFWRCPRWLALTLI